MVPVIAMAALSVKAVGSAFGEMSPSAWVTALRLAASWAQTLVAALAVAPAKVLRTGPAPAPAYCFPAVMATTIPLRRRTRKACRERR